MAVTREREAELDALIAQARAGELGVDDEYLGPSIVERCVYCRFVFEGPVGEARERFAEHECDRPRVVPRPRNRGFQIRH